ncbi:MAG: ankyrin repeat domain-containing protein [Deltaproteobacteria bacterium]|nr:ankyrin repeat domain-containing protein [Deltaproteobacteria bacterium]MCL5276626.1 ankyrin repeat domain-containing protein [Deltaproteobacteria bacterium]
MREINRDSIEKMPLSYKDEDGNTVLHLAVLRSYDDFKKVLSMAECSEARCMNARNREGDTPLHLAIKNNFLNKVRDLVEAGAKTDVRNNAGLDAAELARRENESDIIEYLESVMISIYD